MDVVVDSVREDVRRNASAACGARDQGPGCEDDVRSEIGRGGPGWRDE